jgi:hypothetical protein
MWLAFRIGREFGEGFGICVLVAPPVLLAAWRPTAALHRERPRRNLLKADCFLAAKIL